MGISSRPKPIASAGRCIRKRHVARSGPRRCEHMRPERAAAASLCDPNDNVPIRNTIASTFAMCSAARTLVVIAAVVFTAGCTRDTVPLIERINAYRTSPQTCEGKPTAALGPLAPAPVLAQVEIRSSQESLNEALRRAGYSASRAQAVVISGPGSSGAAMGVLKERYCQLLASAEFSEIGISREGKTWSLVLAQPLIPADLGGWAYAGKEILARVNEARAKPRACGAQQFGAAPALEWDAKLGSAALAHSREMAAGNFVAHAGRDGSQVGDRAARAGYEWTRIGENIASGQGSIDQAVSSWLASPHHCVNVMQPDFTQMGAAYVINETADSVIYWTQVFGTPSR
jgi:uncharacterized protein YkwD